MLLARRHSLVARSLSTFAGPRQRAIEDRLAQVFSPTHLEVLNESHGRKEDESHFKVVIVSDAFESQRLIARGDIVETTLEPLGTFTPAEGYHQAYLAKRGQSDSKGSTEPIRCYG